jgi:hypothetical protein
MAPRLIWPSTTGTAVDTSPAVDGGGIDGAALPACASLVNPLYIMSGDTQVPVLKTLGKALAPRDRIP